MKLVNNNTYLVYKHVSPSGKVYIGITKNSVNRRWKGGSGYKHCSYFFKAITKYGWDNIQHIILYSGLSKLEACNKEKELIKYYKDLNLSYNLSDGGETNKGYKASDKQREHAKNIWKGKKLPKEVIDKLRVRLSERICKEETKVKRSQSLQKFYAKKIYKLNKLGHLLAVYNSLQEAAENNNAKRCQIAQCCNKGALVFKNHYYLYEQEYINFDISKRPLTHNKPIIVYKKDIFIGEYNDVKEASEILNINYLSLKRACTDFKRNHLTHGYTVKYKY